MKPATPLPWPEIPYLQANVIMVAQDSEDKRRAVAYPRLVEALKDMINLANYLIPDGSVYTLEEQGPRIIKACNLLRELGEDK